jgi:DNA-binding FrmR family transcriptional regulator
MGYGPCYNGYMTGYSENKDAVLRRLDRIAGQVRGLRRMVESDTYCIDVLTQVSATTRALESTALSLLAEHLNHCVADAVAEGGDVAQAKLDEANTAIRRLVRS